jgi:hypothetical protein
MLLNGLKFDVVDDHIITEEQLWEMARVKPAESGIPFIMFVSTKEYVKGKHWARIKVSNVPGTFASNDNFVVSIDKNPAVIAGTVKCKQHELQDVFDWIILNYETLIKYWNEQFSTETDFYNELKKV